MQSRGHTFMVINFDMFTWKKLEIGFFTHLAAHDEMYALIFRSTPKSRLNKVGLRCPSVRSSIRPQKVFPIPMKFGM